jgi:LysR family transcriptional regulator, nitrogen assimilation regulatory protein
MDLLLLEYFLRVTELGSINKAAGDLQLSQSALSRHVAGIEHELGTPLFTRTRGGVVLTEAGSLLADRARPLLRQFAILKEQLGERAGGQIALGIPQSWQQVFTTRFVSELARQAPGLSLRIHEGVSHVLREHMLSGLLDMAIVPFDLAPAAGYRQTTLLSEPIVLVGPVDAGLQPHKPVPLSRLDGLQLVVPSRPNAMRVHIENTMARMGLHFRAAVETDTVPLCLELARQKVGFTLVPSCAAQTHSMNSELSWAPIRGQFVTWALTENVARTHSQAVRHARRVLLATVRQRLLDGTWPGAERVGSGLLKASAAAKAD